MVTIIYKCTLLITPQWRVDRRVTWSDYLAMSKSRSGEGVSWKALI